MPKCVIDGKEIEVAAGTTVLQAALDNGIDLQYFCWHPDLPVDGNCRTCMVEIEKMPKLQIACNTAVTEGMVVRTTSAKAKEAQRSALEFLLVNHPIDCPVCDQAGECYLQDSYMKYGLHDSQVEIEEKVKKRKVVDLGPIMLDAERCVLCSRCLRFESHVTGTNTFEFVNRGDHTQIATFENGPVDPQLRGQPGRRLPGGRPPLPRLPLQDAGLVPEDPRLGLPGLLHRLQHPRGRARRRGAAAAPRRNVEVNKSWMCDLGRAGYKDIAVAARVTGARLKGRLGVGGRERLRPLSTRWRRRSRMRRKPPPSWPARRPPTRTSSPSPRWRAPPRAGSTSGWATPTGRSACGPTRFSCARIATPTRRAASTRAWGAREWPRS